MKLIHYLSGRYIMYSAIISIIAVPLFYLSLQHLLLKGLDEEMKQQKNWIEKKLNKVSPKDFISFENNVTVTLSKSSKKSDVFFSEPVFVETDQEVVMHRVLLSNMTVNGKNYTVRIQKSMIEDEDLLKSILMLQLVFIFFLILGLGLINFSISKKLWLPFNDIVKKMKNYRVDISAGLHFMPTNIIEFKDLENSISELVDRNNTLYRSQKEFTENASHELQTPIAVFHSKLELLMQTAPISEEQAGLIEELFLSGERMQRINRTLLLLTKIENNQFPDTEKIAVKKVFANLITQYQTILLRKNVSLEISSHTEPEITANPILIDILFGNLLSNAFKYTEEKNPIKVDLSDHSVCVSNESLNGAGRLAESDLFQRFKKQSNDSSSLGLGLEICKKIADLYHYKIGYDFADNRHFFTIYFK
ncbi:MAG: HAMP domain-containing histidine kinase [Chryseobacterium sp.]|uniref:sensor histidine kinase n=1 Tax=Chryseobacterium sp. TaxID=1871047 RepID=UPI0025BB0412|nr:HAMP domain-containing sensor histidine kinase [Chryseobacterium sp.]MCJ7936304.1 HAMP domain-containing histidine kinase [Chryseobacterium sp.]